MNKQKLAYRILQGLYGASAIFVTVFNYLYDEPVRAMLGVVIPLFLLIPPIAERLLRLKLGYVNKIIVLAFAFLAYNLGTALRFYDRFGMYDNAMHLLSGILFTLFGLCFYARLRKSEIDLRGEWFLQLSYAFCFSMFIAVLWEIYEFLLYVAVGHDAQKHLTTGVFDTMEDIVACALGSLVMAGSYILYAKKGVRLLFMRAYDDFARLNPKKK